MQNVMLDIETTGTDPIHSNIIQISAVRFDLDNKRIDDNMFDQCLHHAPGRWWDESTRDWWMSPDRWPIYCDIASRMRPPTEVMQEFQEWVLKGALGSTVRLWAKPTSFEYPFISSYFKQFEVHNPFHYRFATDLNSYIYGRGHQDINRFWDGIEKVGDAHNALHDVLYQIRGAFSA